MAQCKAKTRKGARCRRDASEGSEFCGTHREAEPEARARSASNDIEADLAETLKTLLGVTALSAIVFAALKLGKRF
ncbi:MAG TPA: hypothetical protein VGA70_02640 [Longimicrobiales bacterium]